MSDEPELACYESPLAQPRVRRKALKRCLKLLRKVTKSADGQKRRTLKRGVVEVTKTIRKEGGGGGLVFMASDVFPVDIISHAFVGPKALLGEACGSVRRQSLQRSRRRHAGAFRLMAVPQRRGPLISMGRRRSAFFDDVCDCMHASAQHRDPILIIHDSKSLMSLATMPCGQDGLERG
eukprot:Polyplicarium_translucidae@DN2606_c0_g1_i11.p1